MNAVVDDLPTADAGRPGPVAEGPRDPIRIPMSSVLLVTVAVLVVELVTGLLTRTDLHLLWLGMSVSAAVLFGLVFSLGAITIAGFAAGAASAGVVVLEPGHLVTVLLVLVVTAVVCGLAPGWARVEAWQAVRSTPLSAREEGAVAQVPLVQQQRASLPSRLRVRWRSDRVFAAFLVLAFPPVFVTAAIAFVTWTENR
ncbi:hypothetical protein SAMN05660199_02064 [Klenkia soli]|uniref:Uncharacterized protein n=1 Tax=Klenkia soli TaxID=1052260 RepID=A0A1H0K931_9ACTN|nr:hypothetical protein [Klenkia soli]SDO52231.1 hypothetical protein SAMN05660199_02064 [Klenkia soli]